MDRLSKVYAWENDDFVYSEETNEPIIGDVTEIFHDRYYIRSTVDEVSYFVEKDKVYPVGDGPVMSVDSATFNVEDIFEDIPDDPDHVLLKIPYVMTAQSGLDIGDEIVVEYDNERLIIRKKEDRNE